MTSLLECPLVLVWDDEEAWSVARLHPALKNAGMYGLSVYARVFRCRLYGGHLVLLNEEDGECGLFIVGKVSRDSLRWVVPVAGLLGYRCVTFLTDRPVLERLGRRYGCAKDKDGFMTVGVWSGKKS